MTEQGSSAPAMCVEDFVNVQKLQEQLSLLDKYKRFYEKTQERNALANKRHVEITTERRHRDEEFRKHLNKQSAKQQAEKYRTDAEYRELKKQRNREAQRRRRAGENGSAMGGDRSGDGSEDVPGDPQSTNGYRILSGEY